MEFTQILFEKKGPVRILTLNRPDIRNVITGPEIIEEIVAAVHQVQNDPGARALVITGAGSAFSAGGDVKEMARGEGMFAGTPEKIADNYRAGIQRIPRALHALDVPAIAAVNGPAIGAGCDLACMCDVRMASETAKFGETFAALGLVPGDGGAYFLPRAVGASRAAELSFTARVFDAFEALEMGLVSRVTPPADLMRRALELAEAIAARPGPTLRMTKRLLRMARTASLTEVLDASAAFQGQCHHLPEHKDAVEAFLNRKK
ncbi:MAG: crotonase/enoyl-CoA hydratase family protein [Proteobacteria bacterium]|nr:crotonase/enoyl-CoA hydratase family protein [Pseudomonadota bacterium]